MVSPIRSLPALNLPERGQYSVPGGTCATALVSLSTQGRTWVAVCSNHRVIHLCGVCSSHIAVRKRLRSNKVCGFCLPGCFLCPWSCRVARSCLPCCSPILCQESLHSFCSHFYPASASLVVWACLW